MKRNIKWYIYERIKRINFIKTELNRLVGKSLFKNLELYSDITKSKYTLQDFRREFLEICRREIYSTLHKPNINILVDEIMVSLVCREGSWEKVTKALWNCQLRKGIIEDFKKYEEEGNKIKENLELIK